MHPDVAEPDDDSISVQAPDGTGTSMRGGSAGTAPQDDAGARLDVERSTTGQNRAGESRETAVDSADPEATRDVAADPAAERTQSRDQLGFRGEYAGAQIGPYSLLQKIGDGGMGVVYLAEQVKPVRHRWRSKSSGPAWRPTRAAGGSKRSGRHSH